MVLGQSFRNARSPWSRTCFHALPWRSRALVLCYTSLSTSCHPPCSSCSQTDMQHVGGFYMLFLNLMLTTPYGVEQGPVTFPLYRCRDGGSFYFYQPDLIHIHLSLCRLYVDKGPQCTMTCFSYN